MGTEILVPCETIKVKVPKAFLKRIRLHPQFKYYVDMEEFTIDALRHSIEQLEKNLNLSFFR